jgi:tetratricopeptide (TPR) repeat protein
MSLNNLGASLRDLGRREEALKATGEAVELYRRLAQRHSDAFQSGLAMSLNNLGPLLSEMGRREEALKATVEAVELRRALAQRHPDALQPDLAGSLNNLGLMFRDMGRHEDALVALEEAVDKLWPFFERLPAAHIRETKTVLASLQRLHLSLGQPFPVALQERMTAFERLTKS